MTKGELWAIIPLWVTITGLSVSHRTFGFPEFGKLRVGERCGRRGPALPLACLGKFCKVRLEEREGKERKNKKNVRV